METIIIIGRILFGALILFAGINHFTSFSKTIAYTKSKRVPAPALATAITGLMLLFGGLAFIANWYIGLGALILVIFFVPTTLMMHNFWKETDPTKKMTQMHFFMGNMMVVGLLLMMIGAWA